MVRLLFVFLRLASSFVCLFNCWSRRSSQTDLSQEFLKLPVFFRFSLLARKIFLSTFSNLSFWLKIINLYLDELQGLYLSHIRVHFRFNITKFLANRTVPREQFSSIKCVIYMHSIWDMKGCGWSSSWSNFVDVFTDKTRLIGKER